MTKPNSRRARKRALNIPPSRIRWADTPRPNTRWRWIGIGAALAVGVAIPAAARPELGATPRLAPEGCTFHTVVPGDTVWAIAGAAGITLDVVARLNPGIPKLNVIRPNDQVATSCPEPSANEVQRVELAPAVVLVNVDRWLGELERPGVASKRAVLAALYKSGARGEQLITLAALTEGESGRQLSALGDVDIQSGDWGPSRGVFQIRTLKSQTGKGTTRDIERVGTLEGGARSAVELWNQSQERGKAGGNPWTAFQKSWHTPYMGEYTKLANEMGL